MNVNSKKCRGSITLEAAVSLTMLLLVGFTLILLARYQYAGEILDQALFEVTDTASFAIRPGDGAVGQLALGVRLEQNLKQQLTEKGFNNSGCRLTVTRVAGEGYQLEVVCRQPTPLLGTLEIRKNYHVLNAGFVLNQNDETVFVTNKGECYHEAGCHTLRESKTTHSVKISEAVTEGYRPCKICIGHTLFGKPYED